MEYDAVYLNKTVYFPQKSFQFEEKETGNVTHPRTNWFVMKYLVFSRAFRWDEMTHATFSLGNSVSHLGSIDHMRALYVQESENEEHFNIYKRNALIHSRKESNEI